MSLLHKRLGRKHLGGTGSKKENRLIKKSEQNSIFLDLSDESFALYYLGLTYHFKAKELLSTTNGLLDDNIRNLLNKAIVYYKQNLELNKVSNDKVAEGRTLGNIGNVNYLLQDYSTAVEYLDKRLIIAKECNDQAGQRRAHGNLGNAHLYLEDFDKALYHYREAMNIGESMNDTTFVARMNFTIGRIYVLKQDIETSIYFHEKHLYLARQLHDSVGQCRAYCVLSQLHEKLNQIDKAHKYESLHKALAKEIGEPAEDTISMLARGEKRSGSTNNFSKNLCTDSISISVSDGGGGDLHGSSASSSHSPFSAVSNSSVHSSITDVRSLVGSKSIPADEKSISTASKKSKANSGSLKSNFMHHLGGKKSPIPLRKESMPADHDELVELVCRMQKTRFEDQRCNFKTTNATEGESPLMALRKQRPSAQLEDILNTVDRLQKLRLDDQRSVFPSASSSHDNNNNTDQRQSTANEEFFDQLIKCQDSRFDDQRAVLTSIHNQNVPHENLATTSTFNSRPTSANVLSSESTSSSSKTLPDDDFFSLLQRLQSRRIDQQRTCLPPVSIPPTSPLATPSSSSTPSKQQQRTRVKP